MASIRHERYPPASYLVVFAYEQRTDSRGPAGQRRCEPERELSCCKYARYPYISFYATNLLVPSHRSALRRPDFRQTRRAFTALLSVEPDPKTWQSLRRGDSPHSKPPGACVRSQLSATSWNTSFRDETAAAAHARHLEKCTASDEGHIKMTL